MEEKPFRLDHPQFERMTDAFLHILGHYQMKGNPHTWEERPSGLIYSKEVPGFLFRGECGLYPTTTPSVARLKNCRQLLKAEVMQLAQISDWIAAHLCEEREGLNREQAFALLQHYGMPSWIVDITGDLGLAFAFAAQGDSSVGRLAVVPNVYRQKGQVVDFSAHPWAERAQRQAAFGVLMDPHEVNDLKADAVRASLNIKWFEFKILPSERTATEEKYRELLLEPNDASAGFVRYYITRYVEAHAKLSPALTEWLLKNAVIAPFCCFVKARDEKEADVRFRGSEYLPVFDKSVETGWSRRYWSSAHKNDRSEARVKNCVVSQAGSIWCDPRTFHPEGLPGPALEGTMMKT